MHGHLERLDVLRHRAHAGWANVRGNDKRPARGEASRLAARRSTHVGDPHLALGVDEIGEPLRRFVLDVPVVAHPDARRDVHPLERRDRVIAAEVGDEALDDPVGIAEPGGLVREGGGLGGDPAQDRVDERSRVARSDRHGRADCGMRGGAEERELVGTETKGCAHWQVGRLRDETIDEPVARSPHAQRSVHELGRERPIAV